MATPQAPTTPTPAPTTPATGALPAYANNASLANLNTMAGPMQGATTYTPDEKALSQNQLSTMLNSDSPYLTAARTRAAQLANGRGLLNSSMAAGAGEMAAIEAAAPFALQDASTHADAQKFNAGAKNDFARDANAYGRQGALAQFQGVLDQGAQGRTLDFQRWQTNEQTRLDQARLNEQIRSTNLDNTYRNATLAEQKSEFKTSQDYALDRMAQEHVYEMEKLGFNAKGQTSQQFAAGLASATYDKVQAVITDPDIDSAAKPRVIQNLVSSANAMAAWGESFYGTDLPAFTAAQFTTAPVVDTKKK